MYGNPLVAANRGPQGTYQIKILIPKTASASIIGRSGVVIRRMAEVSNCKIQLGNENDPFNTKERIVTLNSAAVPNLVLVSYLTIKLTQWHYGICICIVGYTNNYVPITGR